MEASRKNYTVKYFNQKFRTKKEFRFFSKPYKRMHEFYDALIDGKAGCYSLIWALELLHDVCKDYHILNRFVVACLDDADLELKEDYLKKAVALIKKQTIGEEEEVFAGDIVDITDALADAFWDTVKGRGYTSVYSTELGVVISAFKLVFRDPVYPDRLPGFPCVNGYTYIDWLMEYNMRRHSGRTIDTEMKRYLKILGPLGNPFYRR